MKIIIVILLLLIISDTFVTCSKVDEFSRLNFEFLFAKKNVITGPRCIPLKSNNILANPYHPSLLSRKGAEVRKGLGIPQILNQNPLACPIDSTKDCTFNVDKTFTISVSNSYSISLSNSKSFSKSLGVTNSSEKGNSKEKSISNSAEKVLSSQITQTNEETIADQINNQFQSTHEKSSGITLLDGREVLQTDSVSQDSKIGKTETNEKSSSNMHGEETSDQKSEEGSNSIELIESSELKVDKSVSGTVGASVGTFFGSVEASVTVGLSEAYTSSNSNSNQLENNWNKVNTNSKSKSNTETESAIRSDLYELSNGKSNSNSNSHTSSSSLENIRKDTISVAVEKINQNSKTKSEEIGTTESKGSTYTISENFRSDEQTNIAHNLNEHRINTEESSTTIHKSTQTTFTVSVSANQGFTVKPGECKILVCYPFVFSVAVPYDCVSEDGSIERVNTEMMLIDSSTMLKGNLTCAQSLINCEDKDKGSIFLINKIEYNLAIKIFSSKAHFDYGKEFNSSKDKDEVLMISDNLKYQLVLLKDGDLVIKLHNLIIWQTEMNFFTNFPTRIRINEKGHLIQESQDLFTNTYPDYRNKEWLTVWSSAPINHNVTIGIPFNNGISYVLVLSDSGVLNLYDSVGALIWCTDKDCDHRFGYKFPEVYLIPILSNSSDFSTPYEPNNHNSILNLIEKSDYESLYSIEDENCDGLKINVAILSPNQRFKMILEESGNLVVKDGVRTMWESVSANINYALGPYELIIGPTGNLIIRSKNNYLIWNSVPTVNMDISTDNYTQVSNYMLKLLDEGRLVIKDENTQTEIWESWPIRNMNTGITYYRPIEYRYIPCHGEPFINMKYLISTEGNNTLFKDMNIISKNGIWDLVILDQKKLVIRKLNMVKYKFFSSRKSIEKLILNKTGFLQLFDNQNVLLWSKNYFNFSSQIEVNTPFTLEFNNFGELIIKDDKDLTIWNYKEELLTKHELKSDSTINILKYGQCLESINQKDYKLSFSKNKIQLFRKKSFVSDFFLEKECSNTTYYTRPEKMQLSDGKISLYDKKGIILCEIEFVNKKDGPFKLVLNDATVYVYNSKKVIVWQKKLGSDQ